MKIEPGKTTIAFIGLGVMGKSMAGHLLKAGFDLHLYTRTKSKAQDLLGEGARWHDSAGEAAAAAGVVITIVGYPKDVEEVYLGKNGIVSRVGEGALLIDMTTSSPKLAQIIHEAARQRGVGSLDAPVSGGDIGAREARLSIMAGGDREDFQAALPVFKILGQNIVYQGPAGSGQHAKMANQIAIAAGMLGVCEALAYARKAGLDEETVLESISGGAAGSWSLSNLAPRMIRGNFEPGFYVKHFIKDMGIAIREAERLELDLPGLQLAKELYGRLAAKGGENLGTQALYKLYR